MKKCIMAGLMLMASLGLATLSEAAPTTLQNAVSTTGNGSPIAVDTAISVGIAITGTFNATVQFQGSADNQTTWYPLFCQKSNTTVATETTNIGVWTCNIAGLTHVRAPVVWASGASVTVTANVQESGVGIAGSATAAAPTLSEGARGYPSYDLSDNQRMTLGTLSYGEDPNADILKVEFRGYPTSITTATTTTLKTGAGLFQGCHIFGGTLGNVTIYDNTAASGTVIVATFTPTTSDDLKGINSVFSTGLTVVTAAATNMTCVWR